MRAYQEASLNKYHVNVKLFVFSLHMNDMDYEKLRQAKMRSLFTHYFDREVDTNIVRFRINMHKKCDVDQAIWALSNTLESVLNKPIDKTKIKHIKL